jgi:DNA-binding NtrC family response regulator
MRNRVPAGLKPLLSDATHSVALHQFVILVADDEVIIRNLVMLLMQLEGYLVLTAADGQEALDLSRTYSGKIDLVMTDMQMPRLNGSDLCAHLLEERPGIKILVMSGMDIAEIVDANVHMQFLPKPFDGETIKTRVREILSLPPKPSKTSRRCNQTADQQTPSETGLHATTRTVTDTV